MKFSKGIVIAMLSAVFIFTIVMIIIFCVKGDVPDQLILCYFGFWGVEGGALAWIKNVKTKKGVKKKKEETEEIQKNE